MNEIDFAIQFENEIFDMIENKINSKEEKSIKPLNEYCSILEINETKEKLKEIKLKLKKIYSYDLLNLEIFLLIKGKWVENNFSLNDTVFINCQYYNEDKMIYELNDNDNTFLLQNFIIIEPEIMLGSTLIKYGFPCLRRAIFNEFYKVVNKQNKITIELVTGIIVHEIFEYSLIKGEKDLYKINQYIEDALKKHYMELALLNLSIEEARKLINEFVELIIKFFDQFYIKKEKIDGLKIKNVLSSEKMYQSQYLGIKGKMDLLVEVESEGKIFPVPMELKTGKNQKQKDIIQVMIYCLLLCDHLSKNNYSGILIYLKSFNTYKIKLSKRDVIDVMTMRNNLAKNFKNIYTSIDSFNHFPPMYSNINECKFCFVKDICFLHNLAYENPSEKDINYTTNTKKEIQINKSLREYYEYFLKIINQENNINYLEQQLLFSNQTREVDISNDYISYLIESFIENDNSYEIIISNKEECSISDWFIESLNDFFILYEPHNKFIFKGMLVNKIEDDNCEKLKIEIIKKEINIASAMKNIKHIYVKSFYLSNYSFKLMRGNLISFILYGSDRLKQLIIESKEPLIDHSLQDPIIKFISKNYQKEFTMLNKYQQISIVKSLLSKDYSLIMGFPGSGKTTVIALLIDILSRMKKKVLVTALTNCALDNILVKLKKRNLKFVRISNNENVVDHQIRQNMLRTKDFDSIIKVKEMIENTTIYGTTVCGINHLLFGFINFDYCIVDEACQILEPFILGPLMLSEKFILVGDPFQLNAIIRSEGYAPMSLFERLYSNHTNTGVQLFEQVKYFIIKYRMNENILLLSNLCVYDKNMNCANKQIAEQKLKINFAYLEKICSFDWIKYALNPDNSVVFLDYSIFCLNKNIPLDKIKDSNKIEADFICILTDYLHKLRFNFSEMSIITPYKNQESLLKKTLSKYNNFDNNILTIDKSQGTEKEMIIISFVKTNKKTKILKDIQRINVAFTRSKSKLIIIGLLEYLETVDKLKNYMEVIKEKKWVYEIK